MESEIKPLISQRYKNINKDINKYITPYQYSFEIVLVSTFGFPKIHLDII